MKTPVICGALVLVVATGVFFFVYLYPTLFPALRMADDENYAEGIQEAVGAQDIDRALRIARKAVRQRSKDPSPGTVRDELFKAIEFVPLGQPEEPEANVLYGRLLAAKGRFDEALEQFRQAVAIERESTPPFRETRKPCYYAPARLSLGATLLREKDSPRRAVVEFELARGFSWVREGPFNRFRPEMYEAYRACGLWGRALDWHDSSAQELRSIENSALLSVGHWAEGHGDWILAAEVARELVARNESLGEAHYLLGRAAMARGELDDAVQYLEEAVARGRGDGSFYLGWAHELRGESQQAVAAYLETPEDNPYRVFALARSGLQYLDPERSGISQETLLDRFDDALHRLTQEALPLDQADGAYSLWLPTHVDGRRFQGRPGMPVPVIAIWRHKDGPQDGRDELAFQAGEGSNPDLTVRQGDIAVTLQWQDNLVYWGGVAHLSPEPGDVPGWVDTARDWFGLREETVAGIGADPGGTPFLYLDGMTWYYSAPVPLPEAGGYVLLGRIRSPEAPAFLRSQFVDEDETVLFEQTLRVEPNHAGWQWVAGYSPYLLYWDWLRVQLGVSPGKHRTDFADAAAFALREPALDTAS